MKKIAIAFALLPAVLWILLFVWDSGATLLPVLALIWGIRRWLAGGTQGALAACSSWRQDSAY